MWLANKTTKSIDVAPKGDGYKLTLLPAGKDNKRSVKSSLKVRINMSTAAFVLASLPLFLRNSQTKLRSVKNVPKCRLRE
jgi:hypothetical protein